MDNIFYKHLSMLKNQAGNLLYINRLIPIIMTNTKALNKTTAKKVLVVEDDGEMGLVLDMILSGKNIHLDYVDCLLSAEEYLKEQEPAVILLDNQLPDGLGVDFISYLKKKYPAIKIIMISGLGSARDVALENGAEMFFEKPFALEEFDKALSSLLQ
ncbi:MAG: response regulator [Chitinophagaceae bacterium]|nr:response regulator [Chitinophagaceae bacterium]MBK8605289.1 response regulator [Chitinophagaceae bacterium]MBP6477009.1 response regulator [Chitinophagaceae bacterium]MBP7108837.1 response regulator [Chitinophagaceae bacterium]MBP7315666.1 response regulator [Chitinophagaceae bacterium]